LGSTGSSSFGCAGFGAVAFNGYGYTAVAARAPRRALRWYPGLARVGRCRFVVLVLVGVCPVSISELLGCLACLGVAWQVSLALRLRTRCRCG
jgi:hypothetical protein